MHVQDGLRALRTAVPYIRAYKGRVFVIKVGGELCIPGATLEHLVEQFALLHQLGIKLVIVHGGGPQATALARRLGVETTIVAGRRVTDAATLEVAKMAFAGSVNTDLVAALRRGDVPAVGLSGADARLISARRRPVQTLTDPETHQPRTVDFGFVGDISSVNADVLRHLLGGDYVPVVCALGADDAGQLYNINADSIAGRLAVELRAAKYFLLTNVDGVFSDPQDPMSLQTYLDLEQLDELLAGGGIRGGMLPKLQSCVEVLRGGVPRVHIVNGHKTDTLLAEVFTNEGCGTLIVERRERGKANGAGSAA